jgi:type IV secretion system protein VirB6
VNWTLFADIAGRVEDPLLTAINGVTDSLLVAVAGPFRAALVIYVALVGFMITAGKMTEPLRDTWGRLGKGTAVALFLTAATYNQYVRDFFLHGIPNDLTAAITGAAGTIGADSFDHVWNKAFAGGLAVWKNLSWTDFGLQSLIVVYWMSGAVATAFGFLVWLVSHIMLGLFVAIGPLIVGMFLFPATRSIFERWIGAMLSMIFLQVFVVTMLVVLTGAENALLANITTAGGGNPVAQIQVLLGAIILFIVAGVIIVQLPGAAAALAGGMHFHANVLARATFGSAIALGQRTVSGTRQLAGNAGHAAQRRLTAGRIPGPSMSSSLPSMSSSATEVRA